MFWLKCLHCGLWESNWYRHPYRETHVMEPVLCILGNISFLAKMADFFDQLNAKIVSRCSRNLNSPHCLCWMGANDKKGYGILSVVWPDGKRRHMRVHRAAFMAHFHLLPNQTVHKSVSGEQLDVSHRCHSPKCVEPGHLILEEHSVNNSRKVCHSQGFCSEAHSPNCIF